jgi:tetratricopeptide (TPR) repeat protein
VSLASDTRFEEPTRITSARRAWGFAAASPAASRAALAAALEQGLRDLAPGHFPPDLALALARELRTSGHAAEARRLLDGMGVSATRSPELLQEAALGRLREGPPERALGVLDSLSQRWPPARFAFAEAQFFAAHFDSALAAYQRIAADPEAPDAGAALERTYLLEEQPGARELHGIATLAWQRWRGDTASATRVADSLFRATPVHSHYAATIALQLAELRAGAGNWAGALVPLAMVNDSLSNDRLAPVARQRTGEAYLQLQQPKQALAAFEECLARFPRAWNAPEVRRRVEKLRREMRL